MAEDQQRLLDDFYLLSQARPQAFMGIASITITDMLALYAQEWDEGLTPTEYIATMLMLDAEFRDFHKRRQPAGKN